MPYQTPCTTINKVCGSSLKAVMIGASDIRAKVANLIVAGGMESMSNAPFFIKKPRKDQQIQFSDLEWILSYDGLRDAYSGEMMGETGETVLKNSIFLEKNLMPMQLDHTNLLMKDGKGGISRETFDVDELVKDEGIRTDTNLEKMRRLRPIFDDNGQVTAGNASQLSDGASAVLITSDYAVEKYNLPILAKILDYCISGFRA